MSHFVNLCVCVEPKTHGSWVIFGNLAVGAFVFLCMHFSFLFCLSVCLAESVYGSVCVNVYTLLAV